jgi:site-specific recombinase XerD
MAPRTLTLNETLDRYINRIALFLRPNTVTNTRSVINGFIRYLKSEYPRVSSFVQVKRCHIEAWITYLGHKPLRRSTRRYKIVKIRSFFGRIKDWAWIQGSGDNLFGRGDLPPRDRGLPRPLSDETDRRLQDQLRRRGGFVHKAVLILRNTGLRLQEFLDLKVDALRVLPGGAAELHVPIGKLHSERVIPVSAETVAIFQELCELRGFPPPALDPETGKPAHFLIVRPTGERIGPDTVRHQLNRIEKDAQLNEHVTPHRLRHTFATTMLRAGMTLPGLMKILGHRNVGMTLRYAEVTGLDVQRAFEKAVKVLEGRYEIPTLPVIYEKPGKGSTRSAILAQLNVLAVVMEAFRQDHATASQKKGVQRLVERIRRLTEDFKGLTK